MKLLTLGGIAMICAATASSQTTGAATSQSRPQTTASSKTAQTVTMTGCVGSLSGSTGGFVLSNPLVIPSSSPTSAARAPESSSTAATPSTPGTSSAPIGTSGAVDAKDGYRLSGTDMSSWAGRRVQIVGVVVPATTGPAAKSGVGGSGSTTGQTLPEFRVQTVQPITGSCPEK